MSESKNRSCIGRIFATTLFVVSIVFMFALFLAQYAWTTPPSQGLFFPFLGLTYPVWLSINCLFLLFWLLLKQKMFFILQLGVLILCWSTILTYFSFHFKTSSQDIPQSSITVFTYNVDALGRKRGDAARTNPIFDYIKSYNADIVCLQEFYVKSSINKQDLISLAEIKEVFSEFPYVTFQANYKQGNSESGLLILSKFPIKNVRQVELWSTFNGAMICDLDVNGKSLSLVNVHLESNRITATDKELYKNFIKHNRRVDNRQVGDNIKERMKLGYQIREKQVKIIHNDLSQRESNYFVICGDFNDTPISYTYRQMSQGLVDSFKESGRGIGITFRERLFPFRIDYILHSPNMQSYNTEVGNQAYSDHYPVITKLHLN